MRKTKTAHKTLNVKISDTKELKFFVKKHQNRNEYINVENYWIRNFNNYGVKEVDINFLYDEYETKYVLDNEIQNTKLNIPMISKDMFNFTNMIIVSDGYNFSRHEEIKNVNSNTAILVVNHAMRFWKSNVFPKFMLVNNTSEVCMSYMPIGPMPQLICSRRTYTNFLKNYKNIAYMYDPVPDQFYQSVTSKDSQIHIDEYRNPICAAITLANYWNVRNIFLAFCGSAYSENRPGTKQTEEGVFQYPQQILADKLVDANLFWYKFADKSRQIFHTGIENNFLFSKYLKLDEFVKAVE